MEEIIKTKRMTCDNCNKIQEQTEIQIGGSPFNGWFRCEKIEITSVINTDKNPSTNKKTFCCPNCMHNYYGQPDNQ